MNHVLPLVLSSSSVFRQQQLSRLGLTFQTAAPNCDETPLPGEYAADTARRLAANKAQSLAERYPQHLIIGADQVALCNGRQLGKPMNTGTAAQMLAALSGQIIDFYTSIALFNSQNGRLHSHTDHTRVTMRALNTAQIAAYLAREPDAIYCAGAAKSEGLGTALIAHIDSSDPNALIGLPLFRLIDFLAAEGIDILPPH